jgi:DNA-binding GntR family transcriptional regulator
LEAAHARKMNFVNLYGQFYDVLEATSEKQELESHRQIIDAIRRRDTEAAQKLMQEHLQVTMDMLRDN